MVKQNDLINAIKLIIEDTFTSYPIYFNKCPDDFLRPSLLLKYVKLSQMDINRANVEKTVSYIVTYFSTIDNQLKADYHELIEAQDSIVEQFSVGHVSVGDRAIKLKLITGSMEEDRVNVELQFEYTDNRTEQEEISPLATTVNTKIEEV